MGRGDEKRRRGVGRPDGASALVAALLLVAVSAAAALAGGGLGAAAGPAHGTTAGAQERSWPAGGDARPLSRFLTVLDAGGPRRLAAASWWGGPQTASTGERVTVFVSAAYAADTAAAQRWADLFASLVHGPELAAAEVYVAPHEEVQGLCRGGRGVLGCYDGRRIVTIGEPVGNVPATAVATHEYGHHLAMNRVNPPWDAVAWGTKRWASHAGVCSRAAAGSAFPGDQGARYTLNPGEAFAEAYRVLNEVRAGAAAWRWDVVDPSFRPDPAALAQVEHDVLRPWTAPTTRLVRKVPAQRPRTWSVRVATPLDGDLRVRLRLRGGAHDVVLLSGDGRRVLARGLWTPGGTKTIEHRLCGDRAVTVRVTRSGAPAPFELSLTAP